SAQIREILISESAWEEMTCLFAPSLVIGSSFLFLFFQRLPLGSIAIFHKYNFYSLLRCIF
ncbi:hypothetical protein M8R66_23440, partial [Enterobacter hormaechei]|nr:hypothetical protein [Enterobacter hormaechei]